MKPDFWKLDRADFEVVSRLLTKEDEQEISARLKIVREARKQNLAQSKNALLPTKGKRKYPANPK